MLKAFRATAFLSTAFLATIVTVAAASSQAAAAQAPLSALAEPAVQSFERLTFRRTTSIGRAAIAHAAVQATNSGLEVKRSVRGYRAIDVRPGLNQRNQQHQPFAVAAASVSIPTAIGRGVTAADPSLFGFPGLTHLDQRTAGTGVYANTQFSIEPPDQGLCVGNGFVMETINNALSVYTQSGGLVSGPIPMSQFFGVAPEIVRPAGPFGPSVGDPRCYFDRDTQRWFITEYEQDVNPSTGAGLGRSAVFVAVSQTSDPRGTFNVLTFDATDLRHPGCPCFPDQPLLGADANGFYISTNEFPIFNSGFNGTQLYALSKLALALGIVPTVVHFDVGKLATPDLGGEWYSVQPATSPDVRRDHTEGNGTEYFLSALDFFLKNDDRLAVWSLTNTASLWNPAPKLTLQHVIVHSEAYGLPPKATQKPGPTPLADVTKDPLEALDTGDDRVQQVVFANGRLWAGLDSVVRVAGKIQAGIAGFVVEPSVKGRLSARVVAQGYVAVNGQNTLYPSIGVNAQGKAILACTLVGPDYYPSAVYVPLTRGNDALRLAGPGAAPDDGFTAYAVYGGTGVARWGDYSAAVADERGNLWFAAEYIPNSPRTPLANWGTFIGEIPGF